jgi:hypothetical protein
VLVKPFVTFHSDAESTMKELGRLRVLAFEAVVEYSIYLVFYSVFPLFLPILLSPLKAFLAFAQPKDSISVSPYVCFPPSS